MDEKYWYDEEGNKWPVPSNKGHNRLRPTKFLLHKRLYDFILERDDFSCKKCGAIASKDKKYYICWSNKWGKETFLVINHIISIRNGGTNHPNNLQVLCDLCNAQKVGLFDNLLRMTNDKALTTKASRGTRD